MAKTIRWRTGIYQGVTTYLFPSRAHPSIGLLVLVPESRDPSRYLPICGRHPPANRLLTTYFLETHRPASFAASERT
ncbi:hypothetical protein P691DRAFT_812655 [Macrolepiota fuliginosa MF-IS2]|uniref:Uncharacterized protein n=1 Tax=Macrolepiota fuliginosa MF-IS2 TaxID=1400762 RepID=A0A9P5XE48_9AGAR|nr:hypothetical protein P691DRAFT_812655 [Macrolepiota fuliginosa MF-IS2]